MSNNHGVRDVTTTTSVIQQQALTSANGTDGQLMGKSVVQSQQQQSQPQTQTVNDIDGTFIQEFLGIQNQVEIMESSQQQIQQAIVEGVQQQQQQQPQIHIQDVSSPELYEIQGGSYNNQENGSNHKVIVVSELFKCEICNLAFIFKDHYFQHCDDHIRMVAEHINLSGIVPIHNFDEVLDFRNDTGSSSEQQQQQQQQQPHQLHEQQHIIVQNHPQNSHHHTVVVNNQHNNVNNNNNNNNDNDTVIEQQQVIGYQQHGQDTIVIGSSSNSNSNSSNCNDRQQQQHHIVTDGAILVKEEMEDDGGDGDQQQQHHMIINDGGAVGGAVTMATITTPTLTSLSSSSGSGSSAVVRRIKKTSQQQNQAALNTDWCKCLSCDFKFKTPISLSRHLNAHMENRNKCVVCNKYFTSCVSLKTHQRIHEAEDVGGGGTDLLQNNINNNNNSNNINSSCNSASGNNGRASVPSSPVSSPGGIGTPLAGNAGGLKVYNCKKCNIQFGTASQYRDHKLTHSNDVYTCNECSKAFLSIINLNRHRQSEHQHRKTFLCVTCNCEFTNEEFLQDHNKTRSHVHKQNTNNVNGNHTGNNNNGGGGGEGLLLDYFEDEEENNDGEDIVLVQQGQVQEVTRTAAGDVVVID